ncbi:hypothetical protein [Streptomyces sp. CAU 1734]|uniref:hypothetical protein n=1 Tax=Streptomyces sp. CAU 1734 TaxID=3140360 RepID=UPI003260F13E
MSVATNLLAANVSEIETDASGWVAGANTTAAHSTRYFSGARSLSLTATAAGSVSATTAARVAVVAGVEYTSYAYFANLTAVAGRVATVRVDWYTAVSGGSPISSITSAGVTMATATTWTVPPPILIGVAPAGALWASVTVSVTGLTAGTGVAVDSIDLGPTPAIAGNLMSYNDQGLEVSTAGWTSDGTAVISRPGGTGIAYEGWYVLGVTSAAPATVKVTSATAYPVTAGLEYTAHSWVQSPTAGGAHVVAIVWYDASNAVISTSSQSWTITNADAWMRCSVIVYAPAGAVTARVALTSTVVSGGQVWEYDQIALRPAPKPAGALLSYRAQSMESGATASWTGINCTISRSTAYAWEASNSCRMTPDVGAPYIGLRLTTPVPVTPREAYTAQFRVRLDASAVARRVTTRLRFFNSGGTEIRYLDLRWTIDPSAGGWYTLPVSAAAPAASATMGIEIDLLTPELAYVDDVTIQPGGMAILADPIPHQYGVTLSISGLTAGGYTYWGLWRMAADGTRVAVRGPAGDLVQETIVGDLAVVEDHEAPLGVPVTYTLQVSTSPTVYRSTSSDSVIIEQPPDTEIVLKDPGLPARQMTAVVAKGGMPTWTRKARQSVNLVRGRSLPVVISDVRTSREGSLMLITETAEDISALWWLLEPGSVLLLHWPPLFNERDVYVSVGDVSEAPFVEHAGYSDRQWVLPLTEVDRPIGGATGSSGRTWELISTEHDTWLSVLESGSTWLSVLTGVSD